MAKSTISIRVDENLKKDTEKTLDDMGMTITTAFTIFAKTLVKEQRFPFEITNDPFYSRANQEYLAKVIKDMEENGGTSHELIDD
ncbi:MULTISPECIES: type II toxin-antitoxin system RelB/DinJ family antitoxin [Pediococcus]|mgnify:CR=1 FL=1|uniref:Addiction module antitoxin RelB n=1 Tax=Pediococcus parvulus TaxID=54062 RepID=A0AAP5TE26_9LACO|nr:MULTISPECIES: type II toxin-antitoxin system RelB/DinJ family antitoxin [Pediococcus]MCT3028268.1 type II toxin-antitoxin system RelB/DinJ family antitoxin [Pediococcus parvulus]MCT3033992.1 type II toxin-antitoxin system RelB/DinJ family antitoxin [Pediococcus parvulus]MDV7695251.1 type II toxin-antitoxin system RelB/DinJ family antitoxin [Pediococcus parvulus]OAD63008.1 addiction module antitoxin RelB [Pediococcus parvulus]HBO46999.1 type II toxin-antitoxin system RelB/DinJ family antitox